MASILAASWEEGEEDEEVNRTSISRSYMPNFDDIVRTSSASLDLPALLRQPTRSLLGVSEPAAEALAEAGIRTIFDLGASQLFASARAVVAAAQPGGASARFGALPGDLLSEGAADTPLAEVPALPVSALRMLSLLEATALATALDVETIRDFASWPPQAAARRLMGEVAGGTQEPDDLQAEELRPRFGQYPTERVYYSTLTMLEFLGAPAALQNLDGPLSLTPAIQNPGGMSQVAIGAYLTFEQSWFAQGITLGQLLHSLSLAPGEATRVAVIDWSRRTSALTAENIAEGEQLDSASSHARSLSEVQSAVAEDFQEGGSTSSSASTSSSSATATSGSSGVLNSLFSSGSSSDTTQEAATTASAASSSWSLGTRSVLGSMTQDVNDRTEQHSTSVRNRRASAVREVTQQEHEQVSTRIVANYNHMHALTVQYYEVVQLYRVRARLHRADRCLFVPMEVLDFSAPGGMSVVERFRPALLAAALNTRIRSLIADDTTAVTVTPAVRLRPPGIRPDLTAVAFRRASAAAVAGAAGMTATPSTPVTPGAPPDSTPAPVAPRILFWDENAVALVSRLVGTSIVRPASDALHMPDDTELLAVSFDSLTIKDVRLDRAGGGPGAHETFTVPPDGIVDLPRHIRLVELDSINLRKDSDPVATGTMTLHCAYLGRRFTMPGIAVDLGAGSAFQKAATFTTDQGDRQRELLTHLQGHREYYSHAVFHSLDSATLTFLLGQFKWNGRPLIDQVEPRPVTVAGNYLILRAPVDATEPSGITRDSAQIPWGQLLEDRGLSSGSAGDERLIPIATGGVFAEAVLGRSNAAEKLDMTRFWHWEDSPIPLVPTEIAPVGTGSRGTAENLTTGQLSSPVLNIVNPTSVPDPAGLGTAFNALANLNFRDMSGLAGTQDLARAASAGTLSAATDAGRLASENLKTEAEKAVAMGQIAADVAKAAIAAGAGTKPKEGSKAAMGGVSREGALLNQGKKMDQERRAAAPGGGTTGSTGSSGTPEESSGGVGAPDDGVGGGGTVGGGLAGGFAGALADNSVEGATFSEIVHGPIAGPLGTLANNVLGFANENAAPKPAPRKPPGPPAPPPPRAQITSEIYAHVRVDIPQLWVDSPDEEVKVIIARTPPSGFWNPNERDFREMARNNVIPQNVTRIENVLGFMRVIPINFHRTNIYGYAHTSAILGLTSEQTDTGAVHGAQDPVTNVLNNRGLSVGVLNQIEVEIAADPGSSLALEVKEIRSAEEAKPDRELWIYTSGTTLNDALMQKIANLFRIRTVTMKQPTWFIPDVTVKPINRKRFGLGADANDGLNTLTDDPYVFDSNVRRFVPQP
ncbi:MAG: hypothetical protein ACT4OZ_11520 [Gemmatimonadota bacterium]